VAESV
jgi:hypothetical protein